jgi:nicotinamide-nucleotide amidase
MIKYGVVSVEVVDEMLDGVLKKFNATYAIAVSGVAGPNGGTKDKPVGTVVVGIKNIFGF